MEKRKVEKIKIQTFPSSRAGWERYGYAQGNAIPETQTPTSSRARQARLVWGHSQRPPGRSENQPGALSKAAKQISLTSGRSSDPDVMEYYGD